MNIKIVPNSEETKYFVFRTMDGNNLALYSLYYDSREQTKTVEESKWQENEKDWVPTDNLIISIIDGDTDFVLVSEDEAKKLFPNAFSSSEETSPTD